MGNLTPLEAAKTPNLDKMAKGSENGLMYTLGRGVKPGSDVAHLAIFGYPMETYYTGRGPIEVAGLGMPLQQGDIAFRGNFATVGDDLTVLDRRAGRIKAVDEFAAAIDGIEIDGVKFIIAPGTAYRAGVIMRGKGLSSEISTCDPGDINMKVLEVKPLDNSPEAKFTASVLNKFHKQAYEILNAMPANKKRADDGQLPANYILVRGAGVAPAMSSFQVKYGMTACCIAGGGLYKGVGAFLGMDVLEIPG
ncbi:MAG: phosphoglycerate mutase, partial [Firmicutes bacterium]|nr:phosphoglycerate mutase [Bacillota bacterium]